MEKQYLLVNFSLIQIVASAWADLKGSVSMCTISEHTNVIINKYTGKLG